MMTPHELDAHFESQLRGDPSDDWMGRLVMGVRSLESSADAPIALIETLAAAAQPSDGSVRPARGRSRRQSTLGLRRGLVFNMTIGFVLLLSSTALATAAGIAPEPVANVVEEITSWVGVDLTPDDAETAENDGSVEERTTTTEGTSESETPGRSEDAGPPENAGPKDDSNAPDRAGPPEHAGPKEDNGGGPPDHAGPPEHAGPDDESGAPEGAGPPEDAGPKDNRGNGQGKGNNG